MKTRLSVAVLIPAVAVLAAWPVAYAQEPGAAQPQASQNAQQAKKSVTPKKVWTDDDLSALRTPADLYLEQQQEAAAKAAAVASTAKPSSPASSAKQAPGALSNPKTVDSADSMIAWEDRDLASQEEYLQQLNTRLGNAPPDQQDHLRDLIARCTNHIAEEKKEKGDLEASKAKLEQQEAAKAAAGSSSSQQTQ